VSASSGWKVGLRGQLKDNRACGNTAVREWGEKILEGGIQKKNKETRDRICKFTSSKHL
jgi:hypothetical protein